jgi:hypothetical protein
VRSLAVPSVAVALSCCAPAPAYGPNPTLLDLPAGRWVKIHEQAPDDDVVFTRQRHGGSAFDSRRGRLVLFGSDTHGWNWINAPLFFDVVALRWSRLYPDDDPATYRVDDRGVPVAGPDGDHPWAMHTLGAVVYDSQQGSLVVSSYPHHLVPGRFTDAVADHWPKIRRHPTWILDLGSGSWTALRGRAGHLPVATAYDPHRGVVIGYKASGVYELSATSRAWWKVADRGMLGWANNVAFDTRRRTLLIFGDNEGANDVVIYEPATGRHEKMPTPGPRPPKSRYAPMAYDLGADRTVVLAERRKAATDGGEGRAGWTETWLYDFGADAWTRLETATLPFPVGMNYNLDYDPVHRLLWLVANPRGAPTAVWALSLE